MEYIILIKKAWKWLLALVRCNAREYSEFGLKSHIGKEEDTNTKSWNTTRNVSPHYFILFLFFNFWIVIFEWNKCGTIKSLGLVFIKPVMPLNQKNSLPNWDGLILRQVGGWVVKLWYYSPAQLKLSLATNHSNKLQTNRMLWKFLQRMNYLLICVYSYSWRLW